MPYVNAFAITASRRRSAAGRSAPINRSVVSRNAANRSAYSARRAGSRTAHAQYSTNSRNISGDALRKLIHWSAAPGVPRSATASVTSRACRAI